MAWENGIDSGVVVAGITSAFGSVSSTFTFARIMAFTIVAFVVVEIFAFSTTTFSVLAFTFGNPEGIATAGLVVLRHVAVVSKEVVHERLESTIAQAGRLLPRGNVGVKLGPWLNRRCEGVDASKFRYDMVGGGEEFVVAGYSATEFADVSEVNQGCSDDQLSSCNLILGECTEHSVNFQDEL
jgi:hypothetical protein